MPDKKLRPPPRMQPGWLRPARPHFLRAGAGAVVAVAGMVVAGIARKKDLPGDETLLMILGAILVLIGGVVAVRETAKGVRKASGEQLGDARGATLAQIVTMAGYFFLLISLLSALEINPAGLLLGGAITGVVVGIAAQQTLGNFFAGIVLLVNRPLNVGEHVSLRSGPLGGEYEGLVTDMTLSYVNLETANGPVLLPNAGVLAASIGPGAIAPKDEPEEESEEEAAPQDGGAPLSRPG